MTCQKWDLAQMTIMTQLGEEVNEQPMERSSLLSTQPRVYLYYTQPTYSVSPPTNMAEEKVTTVTQRTVVIEGYQG